MFHLTKIGIYCYLSKLQLFVMPDTPEMILAISTTGYQYSDDNTRVIQFLSTINTWIPRIIKVFRNESFAV